MKTFSGVGNFGNVVSSNMFRVVVGVFKGVKVVISTLYRT